VGLHRVEEPSVFAGRRLDAVAVEESFAEMVDDRLHAATVRFLGDSERVVHRLARDPLMRLADERLRRLLEEADQLRPGPRPFEVGGIGHRSLERVAANGLFPNEVSSGGEQVGPELRVFRPRSREALRHRRRVHLEERAEESGSAVPVAGIADPASFAAQLGALGADVQLVAYQDHHPYPLGDIDRLVQAAQRAGADYVVVTEKDAVKLRGRWPQRAPEPLVAALDVRWEWGGRLLEEALEAVLARQPRS